VAASQEIREQKKSPARRGYETRRAILVLTLTSSAQAATTDAVRGGAA
jgi:hypothetical protein